MVKTATAKASPAKKASATTEEAELVKNKASKNDASDDEASDEEEKDEVDADATPATTTTKPPSKSKGLLKKNNPAAQQLVDHTYTDYAIVDEDDLHLLDENSSLLPKPASSAEASAREKLKGMSCTYGPMKKNAGGVIQPFPGKLLEVLDRGDLTDIVDWMPHGRSFIVKKPKLFTTEVLPRFFKQTKFLSFTRQLNLWGFKRITKGIDGGAYYHELFLRGRPYLAMRMRRQKIKGTGMKLTPNPEGEPDFYHDYESLPPLNSRRILPPLPPLPAERAQQEGEGEGGGGQGSGKGGARGGGAGANAAGAASVASGYGAFGPGMHPSMMGGLPPFDHRYPPHPYGPYDPAAAAASREMFAQGGDVSLAAAAESRLRHSYAAGAYGRHPGFAGGYPHHPHARPGGWGAGGGGMADDLLLAPGVSPYEASRLRYLEGAGGMPPHHHGARGNGGLNPTNDPIHDELSNMVRARGAPGPVPSSSAAATAGAPGMPGMSGMYPHAGGHPASDRLFMERLRDLDRAAQLKREQQDMSILRRARMYEEGGMGGPGMGGMGHPYADRYLGYGHPMGHVGAPPGAGGQGGAAAGGAGAGQDLGNVDAATSVSDALREANELEELAAAKRAKARSLALAGALQNRMGAAGAGGGTGTSPVTGGMGGSTGVGGNGAIVGNGTGADQTQSKEDQVPQPKPQQDQQQQVPKDTSVQQVEPAQGASSPGTSTKAGAPGVISAGGGPNDPSAEGRPSFGRPFGRRD